jgi:hypothetical protein
MPNGECALEPTRLSVWRRFRRVASRAKWNRQDHGTGESLPHPHRRGRGAGDPPAGGGHSRAPLPRADGLRHLRRGGIRVQAPSLLPVMRVRAHEARRPRAERRAEMGAPRLRAQVQLAHRDRLRACPLWAAEMGVVHRAHALQRAAGLHSRDAPDIAPDRLGMAAQGVRYRGRIPGPHRPQEARLDRRDIHRGLGPRARIRAGEEARPLLAAALHSGRDRRLQEPLRRGMRAREALHEEDEGRIRRPHSRGRCRRA